MLREDGNRIGCSDMGGGEFRRIERRAPMTMAHRIVGPLFRFRRQMESGWSENKSGAQRHR